MTDPLIHDAPGWWWRTAQMSRRLVFYGRSGPDFTLKNGSDDVNLRAIFAGYDIGDNVMGALFIYSELDAKHLCRIGILSYDEGENIYRLARQP